MNKLLILFKIAKLNNEIHKISDKYCSKFKNSIDHYYLYCDETIVNDIEFVDNNIIKMKMKENNWSSILIKVVESFNVFKDKPYSNIMVSNVSTFLNIPVLLKLIDKNCPCLAYQGYNYHFKGSIYNWPSGAGYIFNMEIVNQICNFFSKNKCIESNKLSNDFCNNYPTTDDIFFGYFFHLNNINIKELHRIDLLHQNMDINNISKNTPHIRIKTNDFSTDCKYYRLLYNIHIPNDKYRISLATMTKNQSTRLEEWILYHHKFGIDHFIIFLDNCYDNSKLILNNIKNKHNINIDIYETELMNPNYQDLHWIQRSHIIYNYTLDIYKEVSDWIVFIEVDEFIFNYNNNIDFKSFLKKLNSKSLYINSWDFKGPFDEDKKILGQSYLCWSDTYRFNNGYKFRGKSIINPKFWNKCVDAHHFALNDGTVPHKEFKANRDKDIQVAHGKNVFIDDNIFRIGHFRNHTPSTVDNNFVEWKY